MASQTKKFHYIKFYGYSENKLNLVNPLKTMSDCSYLQLMTVRTLKQIKKDSSQSICQGSWRQKEFKFNFFQSEKIWTQDLIYANSTNRLLLSTLMTSTRICLIILQKLWIFRHELDRESSKKEPWIDCWCKLEKKLTSECKCKLIFILDILLLLRQENHYAKNLKPTQTDLWREWLRG